MAVAMAVAMSSQPQAFRTPEDSRWDDTIVPALRKRLESESRMLSKRMSVASISSSDNNSVRQSFDQGRPFRFPTTAEASAPAETPIPKSVPMRNRTLSNPGLYSRPSTSSSAQALRPSRIPVVKHSTAPMSRSNGRDTGAVTEDGTWQYDRRTPTPTSLNGHGSSGTTNGMKPFILSQPASTPPQQMIKSATTSFDIPRQSIDDERPFQHWYRGDVRRNGGVGELRVGKRSEMLQIATHGYERGTMELIPAPNQRRRANSVSARDSLYLQDHLEDDERVLDERPPDDFEDHALQYDSNAVGVAISTPEPSYRTRIPVQDTTPTPPSTHRAPHTNGRVPTQTPPKSTPPSKRARTKSTTTAAQAKRAKSTPPHRISAEEADVELSNKLPDDVDAMYAIPSWTQPNADRPWDDVVPPALARKMNLDGYSEASPQSVATSARQEEDPSLKPIPGLFGYDYSKYRPPGQENGDVPMRELESPAQIREKPHAPPHTPSPQPPPEPLPPRSSSPRRPTHRPPPLDLPQSNDSRRHSPSPMPFARYVDESHEPKQPAPPPQPEKEDEGAGCCKCIIM